MSFKDKLRNELMDAGHSTTSQRITICETLLKNKPLTMQQLVHLLEGAVDRASIYRSVALFEDLGIVRRIPLGWKYKLELSDKFTDHHHHAHCRMCGKIVTLDEDNSLELAIEKTAKTAGFATEEHHLEIQGVCGGCQG